MLGIFDSPRFMELEQRISQLEKGKSIDAYRKLVTTLASRIQKKFRFANRWKALAKQLRKENLILASYARAIEEKQKIDWKVNE